MPWMGQRGARLLGKNTRKPSLFLLLKHSPSKQRSQHPGPGKWVFLRSRGRRNPSWTGRQPCWLHGRLSAPLSPFSLPCPALLGLLVCCRLGQEQRNTRVRARQWVVHKVPPVMSGACPSRAEKGSGVSTCVCLGWGGGRVLVGQ